MTEFTKALEYFAEGINEQLQSFVVKQRVWGLIHHPGNSLLCWIYCVWTLIELLKNAPGDVAGDIFGWKRVCVCDCV